MDRRLFLGLSGTASAAMLLSSLEAYAIPQNTTNMSTAFDLKILATNWGFNGSTEQFCAAAKKEGYDGIEVWWPGDQKGQDELFSALKKYSLSVGFLCGGYQEDWKEHLETFKLHTSAAAKNKIQRPLYINCHSGRDHFPAEINEAFILHTNMLSKETGVLICHETHRSRIMYAAHVTRQYIQKFPDLRLTLDISHWCNVHESLLADQKETVKLALDRTEHLHARIGHPEGPQVNDPRAPEWAATVKHHIEWWDEVIARKKKTGGTMTILTEFGPADYMPSLPYTRQPLADQWGINVYMMKMLRERYANK